MYKPNCRELMLDVRGDCIHTFKVETRNIKSMKVVSDTMNYYHTTIR